MGLALWDSIFPSKGPHIPLKALGRGSFDWKTMEKCSQSPVNSVQGGCGALAGCTQEVLLEQDAGLIPVCQLSLLARHPEGLQLLLIARQQG